MTRDEAAPLPLREIFRKALRGLAATVNIVTTSDGGQRYGMTATAVMSLSLDPPSLVVGDRKSVV